MENSDKSVFETAKPAGKLENSSRFLHLLFRFFENLKTTLKVVSSKNSI